MENFFTDTYIGWLCRQIVLILPPFSGAPHGIEMAALEANGGMKLATAGFKRETQWSRKYGEQVKRRSVELKRVVSEAKREFEGEEMVVEEVTRSDKEVKRDIEVENDFEKVMEDNGRSKKELRGAMRDALESERNPLEILRDVMEKLGRETEEAAEDHLGSKRGFRGGGKGSRGSGKGPIPEVGGVTRNSKPSRGTFHCIALVCDTRDYI